MAASCAGAGFRGPSGWGRKGRTSRAWTSEESVRRATGNRSSYLSAAAARPGTARPEVGAEEVSAGRAPNASRIAATRPQPAGRRGGDAHWLRSPSVWESRQGPSLLRSLLGDHSPSLPGRQLPFPNAGAPTPILTPISTPARCLQVRESSVHPAPEVVARAPITAFLPQPLSRETFISPCFPSAAS